MSKISEQAADAVIFGYSFKRDNTEVIQVVGGTRMYLYGNLIAEKINDKIRITNDGWFTKTTKERLNAFPNVFIQQVKGKWILNSQPWDGSWIEIN